MNCMPVAQTPILPIYTFPACHLKHVQREPIKHISAFNLKCLSMGSAMAVKCSCRLAYVSVHMHTYIHTYINTYIHTYILESFCGHRLFTTVLHIFVAGQDEGPKLQKCKARLSEPACLACLHYFAFLELSS